MILGVGVDAVEISRVQRSCEKGHFQSHIFTEAEIAQFDKRSALCEFVPRRERDRGRTRHYVDPDQYNQYGGSGGGVCRRYWRQGIIFVRRRPIVVMRGTARRCGEE